MSDQQVQGVKRKSRRFNRALETKNFGPVLGILVFVFLLSLSTFFPVIPERLELAVLDFHFNLRQLTGTTRLEEGVILAEQNPNISSDILIVGVDFNALQRFGNWPFPRARHADLVNSFGRISDQTQRENSVFLDFFFIEPVADAFNDALLVNAMQENGRVFLETVLEATPPPSGLEDELFTRHDVLFERQGRFETIHGNWQDVPGNEGLQPPLQPYGAASGGFGHANFSPDVDEVFRRQALIAKSSELLGFLFLDDLEPGVDLIDEALFQRLAWIDRSGREHQIRLPVTEESLAALTTEMQANAPPRRVELDDGSEDEVFLVRVYQDEFVPAITLALALQYWHRTPEEVEVRFGEYIRIPEPRVYNSETDSLEPYRIVERPERRNDDGEVTQEARYRELTEVRIPIDKNGNMTINFMGPRSSATRGEYQTFPVRSYAGYAANPPGPNPDTWPRTRAVPNSIVMVGAFAPGMAADELTTPFGLMYGIEVHANALNTILMGNFLRYAPAWMNNLVLLLAALIIALATSRLPTGWALGMLIVGIGGYFILNNLYLFDSRGLVVDYVMPVSSASLSFLSVVVYRVATEERDKKRLREMFGKYVSPHVVSEILNNPPELGGVDKELTVMFSDIRGFTTLSESMTPQELVNHLNVYLTAMTDTILEFEGTLDKYVGDEIMCFWGAPLPQEQHALFACRCALKQIEKLNELNESWEPDRRIHIGIGINSGIMTVGNMGSPGRLNYTLMGDNVNLGARLEGTNKQYRTTCIMSEYTYGLVKDSVIARELDNIRVKGKNRPVLIYELLDMVESQ
ncbi:MAG: adenylate/guanylate cyclase domain-containing protein [Spirochaetaceae bacterium]|nr:MAG: adenylate/guanylate cyclase domain-containing protein [Spirochaetaceae bacterium]